MWAKNKIKSYTELENYLEKQAKFTILKKDIIKKLRLHRDLSQFEVDYIQKWNTDFGFGSDIIDIALKRTTSKVNPTFDYIDKLLTDWHSHGLKSVSEIEKYISEKMSPHTNINNTVKASDKKSSFNSYEQRKYDDLDSIYSNLNTNGNNNS